MMLFRDAPAAIRDEGVDALIVDQVEMAGGTVAEHLGLPFVSVALALPLNLDASVPFVSFPWSHRLGHCGRLRNRLGNAFFEWIISGVLRTINRQRRAWGLPPARGLNSLFSRLAQVAQLPAALELPGRRVPPHFHHTGPWTDAAGRAPVDFPWSRLDPGRPLAYASMGTLQNGVLRHLPGHRRGVRGAGPAAGDLARRRAGPGGCSGTSPATRSWWGTRRSSS